MRKMPFLYLCLLFVFIIGSMLTAQDDEPLDLLCDETALIRAQVDLAALLETFSDQLEENADAALETLYQVGRDYQELALDCGYIPDDVGELVVGDDVERILVILEEINGDPLNGQLLYNNEANAADGAVLGCVGCHNMESIAPLTEGTWTRWDEIRRGEPELAALSFEQYIVASIVHPWDYLVPDYGEVMPNNFGDRLSYQDLADLIAYLSSQDQFLDEE